MVEMKVVYWAGMLDASTAAWMAWMRVDTMDVLKAVGMVHLLGFERAVYLARMLGGSVAVRMACMTVAVMDVLKADC
jgi:hypothetical protein